MVVILGAAYYYVIWDCARKNFLEKCQYYDALLELICDILQYFRKKYRDDDGLLELIEAYEELYKNTRDRRI
ncbi:MAG TPA: hypothetical protein PK659_09050 [Methanothrix sp.]|nr:hypothetical protein [Methanothrix sp.]HOL44384.1 hypothetical protein [Methanothrix sp.]